VERRGTNIRRNIRALLVKYAARLGFCRYAVDGSIPSASTRMSFIRILPESDIVRGDFGAIRSGPDREGREHVPEAVPDGFALAV
jgi:hypothetical protein